MLKFTMWSDLARSDQFWAKKAVQNLIHDWKLRQIKEEWKAHPERKEAFLDGLRDQHEDALINGVAQGWWRVDEAGNMLAPAKVFKLKDFPENATLGHVMHKAGIFPSVSQARKNGWNTPIQKGTWTVTKQKIVVEVV